MPERRPVTRETVGARVALKVGPRQVGLVADNVVTLAQAPCETGSVGWCGACRPDGDGR